MPSNLNNTTVEIVNGGSRSLHHSSGTMGLLKTDGNWDMYANNSGQIWTPAYGWLHDAFFNSVANCAPTLNNCNGNNGNCIPELPINCYGSGNLATVRAELLDNGSQIQLRSVRYNFNCNCISGDCLCACGW